MKQIIGRALILAAALAAAPPGHAAGAPTAADLAWLGTTLNLPADSPLIAGLSAAQKARLHDLVAAARRGSERKRQDVVSFLTGAVGDDFEDMLQDRDQLPLPSQLGANRRR